VTQLRRIRSGLGDALVSYALKPLPDPGRVTSSVAQPCAIREPVACVQLKRLHIEGSVIGQGVDLDEEAKADDFRGRMIKVERHKSALVGSSRPIGIEGINNRGKAAGEERPREVVCIRSTRDTRREQVSLPRAPLANNLVDRR